jgi:transmembrane 9 superfamily protein 2/4
MRLWRAALAGGGLVALAGSRVDGYYLPGVAPHDYFYGDSIEVLVNALSAIDSLLPYDYYLDKLHFCQPEGGPVAQRESLGAILFGDRLYNSPFRVAACFSSLVSLVGDLKCSNEPT